jgi:hypothetical protein
VEKTLCECPWLDDNYDEITECVCEFPIKLIKFTNCGIGMVLYAKNISTKLDNVEIMHCLSDLNNIENNTWANLHVNVFATIMYNLYAGCEQWTWITGHVVFGTLVDGKWAYFDRESAQDGKKTLLNLQTRTQESYISKLDLLRCAHGIILELNHKYSMWVEEGETEEGGPSDFEYLCYYHNFDEYISVKSSYKLTYLLESDDIDRKTELYVVPIHGFDCDFQLGMIINGCDRVTNEDCKYYNWLGTELYNLSTKNSSPRKRYIIQNDFVLCRISKNKVLGFEKTELDNLKLKISNTFGDVYTNPFS